MNIDSVHASATREVQLSEYPLSYCNLDTVKFSIILHVKFMG